MRNSRFELVAPMAALIFAALCMNHSWVHAWHDGDSILLSLISIDRWIPFYWGDRRYGMPVPLLASWIQDPVWNLLFQTQLFSLAIVTLLLAGNLFFLHSEGTPLSVRAGTACIAFSLTLAVYRPTSRVARNYFLGDPYVISLAPLLAAAALVFRVQRVRRIVRLLLALALTFVSVWINYSHVLLAVLIAVLIPYRNIRWRQTLLLRCGLVAAVGCLYWLLRSWASRYPRIGEPTFAPDQWLTSASRLLSEMRDTVIYPAPLISLFCAGIMAGLVAQRFGAVRLADGAVFCGSAAVFAVAVAASDWPMHNNFEPRYWTTPLALLLLVAAGWTGRAAFAALERMFGSRTVASAMAVLIVAAASLKVFGAPNPIWARGLVMGTAAKWGEDALKLGCTHIVGDYSIAWMSVFHARATGHEMWAVVPRAEVTRDLWDRTPKEARRYCGDVRNQGAILGSFVTFGIELPPASGSSGRTISFEYPRSK